MEHQESQENIVESSLSSKMLGALIAISFWGALYGFTPSIIKMAAQSLKRGITSYSNFTKSLTSSCQDSSTFKK